MSRFCTGVVVVSAHDGQAPVGLTCQSFSSLSIDPPLILFCPAKSSTSWPKIRSVGRFCVNVLAESQQDVSTALARTGTRKFEGIAWSPGPIGAPRIHGSIAHIECELDCVYEAGDHHIAVARVLSLECSEERYPLIYFKSSYQSLRR